MIALLLSASLATSGIPLVASPLVPKGQGSACSWSALGAGIGGGKVSALISYDDGTGPALYAGGTFTSAGGATANRIARWNGSDWSEVGGGVNQSVSALAVYDDGTGPALYVGGSFSMAGSTPANRIAKWDGTAWSALGSGLDGGSPLALAVWDDGSGATLYAGGFFTSAGGVAANRIAKWDGTAWSALSSGMCCALTPSFPPGIEALAVHDDGTGEALFAAGWFNFAGGLPVASIARWDGVQWSDVGGGLPSFPSSPVRALAVFDEGAGARLFAGGGFDTMTTGAPQDYLARWDAMTWSEVGGGLDDTINALAVYDDGTGSALYALGNLMMAGSTAVSRIARWDGAAWSALGSGLDGFTEALGVHHDGTAQRLYAGGLFSTAGGLPAANVARWSCDYIFVDGFE